MGPILIFDKSMIESLNLDESCFLDNFFITNITPIFFIETLADLVKKTKIDRSSEKIVKNIANKTPIFSSKPNTHHLDLMSGELMGGDVPINTRQILISGGTRVTTGDKKGVFFKPSEEEEAMERWTKEDFLMLEKLIARKWRQNLSNLNLEKIYQDYQKFARGDYPRPKTFSEVKNLVNFLLHYEYTGIKALYFLFDLIDVPMLRRYDIVKRWEEEKPNSIFDFAPYSAYVASIELFFNIAIASDLISRVRKSNKIDIAYLYYLPFCHIFTSGDKLHANIAPLFLEKDQSFINAKELKNDLKKLDEHYSKLPEDVKIRGPIQFAPYPPMEGDFLVSRLWDKHGSSEWRNVDNKPVMKCPKPPKELLDEIKTFKEKAKKIKLKPNEYFKSDKSDIMMLQRKIPAKRGKWRLFPPEVTDKKV